MRKPIALSAATCLSLALVGCLPSSSPPPAPSGAASSSSSVQEFPTSVIPMVISNVRYAGTLEKAGMSIYQEGTHRLNMMGGQFVLLESDVVNLDQYVGREVEVLGDERPTVEAGARILTVAQVLPAENSSGIASAASDTSSSLEASSAPLALNVSSPVDAGTSSAAQTPDADAAKQDRIDEMAKYKMDAANWSQQYCSSHVGFCIPIHKSSWFKSFGVTTSTLWHVELSNEDVQELGDGPIAVNLVRGSAESVGATDKQVKDDGSTVTGYRAWSDDRHFEITGPTVLRQQIEYIMNNLTAGQ